MSRRFFSRLSFVLLLTASLANPAQAASFAVQTIAGRPSSAASTDGAFNVARLNAPRATAVQGGYVFVVENSHAIRRVSPGIAIATLAGVAGSSGDADGDLSTARFKSPEGIAATSAGTLFIADTGNSTVRRITPGGTVSTIAGLAGYPGTTDGEAGLSRLRSPRGLWVTAAGIVYLADTDAHIIRKITFDTGLPVLTTIAGLAGDSGNISGGVALAKFNNPRAVAVASNGDVYVADTNNHAIRLIKATTGAVSTLAGSTKTPAESGSTDGTGAAARFNKPEGITFDSAGNLIVADTGNNVLRKVTLGGVVTTLIGKLPSAGGTAGASDGVGLAAQFNAPRGLCTDGSGNVFVADTTNHTARKVFAYGLAPVITAHPKAVVTDASPTKVIEFTVKATSATALVYEWKRNDVSLVNDGTHIKGANTAKLTLTGVDASDEGAYTVMVSNIDDERTSYVAPLVVTGQQTWLWAAPIGTAKDDAALDLLVEKPATGNLGALWLGARNGGHAMQKHALKDGARQLLTVLDANGDGVNAIDRAGAGDFFLGADKAANPKQPNEAKIGLLARRTATGSAKFASTFASHRPTSFSTNSHADSLGVAVNDDGESYVAGKLQGYGRFGATSVTGSGILVGSLTSYVDHGYVAKFDATGAVDWARDIFSDNSVGTETASVARDVVIDSTERANSTGALYVCGSVGRNARFQKGEEADDASDFEAFTNTEVSRPFVAKYDNTGTLVWVYLPSYAGQFASLHLTATGELWATGYQDATGSGGQFIAVLEKIDPTAGTLLEELESAPGTRGVAGGKGCSLDTDSTYGLAWLVLDVDGNVAWQGRRFGVSGYRVIHLDAATLDAEWDLPVLGGKAEVSDMADIRYGANGLLYVALTFQDPAVANVPTREVNFTGRRVFSLTGRGMDGFVAAIGERPVIATQPAHKLQARGTNVTLTVVPEGALTPSYQWLKSGKPIAGETGDSLLLDGLEMLDAAAYAVRLSNGIDTITSATAEVGVVDTQDSTKPVAIGSVATLIAPAAGNGLTFAWHKDSTLMTAQPWLSGITTRTLKLTSVQAMRDNGLYKCSITGPGGTLFTGETALSVKIKPEVQAFTLSNGQVARLGGFTPTAINDATSFKVTGLPPGMSFNALTGEITGRPAAAGSFTISITATNVAGTSAAKTATLVISPLPPGIAASYTGNVERSGLLNLDLGARLVFTITAAGNFTGKLTIGATASSITGYLDLPAMGSPKLVTLASSLPGNRYLGVTLDPGAGTFDGLYDVAPGLASPPPSVNAVAISGYRHGTAAQVATYAGAKPYNLTIMPDTMSVANSTGSFVVSSTGALTIRGQLADGTPILCATNLGSVGQISFYQLANAGHSSLFGNLVILSPLPGTSVEGEWSWLKGIAPGNGLYTILVSGTRAP